MSTEKTSRNQDPQKSEPASKTGAAQREGEQRLFEVFRSCFVFEGGRSESAHDAKEEVRGLDSKQHQGVAFFLDGFETRDTSAQK